MNQLPRLPGFTAEIALEADGRNSYQGLVQAHGFKALVRPQKSEFVCGLGFASVLMGIATLNPFAAVGGLGAIVSNC